MSQSGEDLKTKLHQKIADKINSRTGNKFNNAKSLISKNQSTKLSRDVRKKGVKALMKHLKINDPEIEQMVAKMISSGEVQDPDELLKKIEEYKAKKNLQKEANRFAAQGPPDELRDMNVDEMVIPTLPGAKIEQFKSRKPLPKPTNSVVIEDRGFSDWLGSNK